MPSPNLSKKWCELAVIRYAFFFFPRQSNQDYLNNAETRVLCRGADHWRQRRTALFLSRRSKFPPILSGSSHVSVLGYTTGLPLRAKAVQSPTWSRTTSSTVIKEWRTILAGLCPCPNVWDAEADNCLLVLTNAFLGVLSASLIAWYAIIGGLEKAWIGYFCSNRLSIVNIN